MVCVGGRGVKFRMIPVVNPIYDVVSPNGIGPKGVKMCPKIKCAPNEMGSPLGSVLFVALLGPISFGTILGPILFWGHMAK